MIDYIPKSPEVVDKGGMSVPACDRALLRISLLPLRSEEDKRLLIETPSTHWNLLCCNRSTHLADLGISLTSNRILSHHTRKFNHCNLLTQQNHSNPYENNFLSKPRDVGECIQLLQWRCLPKYNSTGTMLHRIWNNNFILVENCCAFFNLFTKQKYEAENKC
jgi:hypothetical protein